VALGSTVNICAVNLPKAFDKMIHHGLCIKPMERNILMNLLILLEHWFAIGVTRVKWGSIMSGFIGLVCGIRQGGALFSSQFILTVLLKKLGLLRVISVAI